MVIGATMLFVLAMNKGVADSYRAVFVVYKKLV